MSIWDNPTGCLRTSLLREGDKLRIKSREDLLEGYDEEAYNWIFGEGYDSEYAELFCLNYVLGGYGDDTCRNWYGIPGETTFTLKSLQEVYPIDYEIGQVYIHAKFEEGLECWFIPDGEDYFSDNLTWNEMLEVVE